MASTFMRTGAKLGICTGALLAVGLLGAASASAATTYTVKAGTTTTGTVAVTGKTQALPGGGNQIQFVDTTTTLPLGCVSGTAKGKATLGPHVAATKIGTITKTTWKTCKGPAGISLVPKQSGVWKIVATGPTSGGVTPAAVTGVNAALTGTGCSFTVTGTATGVYDNATGLLKLAPVSNPTAAQKLTVTGVTGCFGGINNNDNVTFTANYKLTSTPGAITIQSN